MTLTRRSFSPSLAQSLAQPLAQSLAAGAGGLALGGCATPPAGEPSLDALARAKGLRFGSTLGVSSGSGRASRFHDEAYRELMARECSVLVAENETKWPQLCPKPPRRATADALRAMPTRPAARDPEA